MQIRLSDITPCCGDQPYLDTWDENEMRSIHCLHCGKSTRSYFFRRWAYDEWEETYRDLPNSENNDDT
jgi:Zn ribbon nucleic-acid-binding protein